MECLLKTYWLRKRLRVIGVLLWTLAFGWAAFHTEVMLADKAATASEVETAVENDMGGTSGSILSRSLDAGPVVFLVLVILVLMSISSWAIVAAKWWHLRRVQERCQNFIKSFWDSRSLNDLNGRLAEYPQSPVLEMFRSGYAELVRGNQMRDQAVSSELAISAALDNLNRTLGKARLSERRKLESFLSTLAITASAAPFIGLFGTVWGIMSAFDSIARTGSSSLAAVAPGISEALIATAFGLAAAIPAVIGYNIANNKIRGLASKLDGFSTDFLNIVERYLVADRSKTGTTNPQSPRI